ncbi:MAG: type II toxin-antitoxin system PemK/MazF family toxin [Ruminococcus flavefaciens]|nr:type II toxin-antitoxin system PemK/MazF family toxin [Ruminococcus flavefaciens]
MTKKLKQFNVVLVDFGKDVIGSEQGGIRPAIIIQNNTGNLYSATTIVIPCSTKIKKITQPTHTFISKGVEKGLKKDSVAMGECLRQIAETRIKKYLGKISDPMEKKEIKRIYDANFGEDI